MSTRTPKPTTASTPIAVFPNPVNVNTVPLPADYPKLPISEMSFQPVAYNQGYGHVTYVTVLVPLPAGQILEPATEIFLDAGSSGYVYSYTINIVTSVDAPDFDNLALMSFSFLTTLSGGSPFKVSIEVLPIVPTTEGSGKVVMDSNMDPTLHL